MPTPDSVPPHQNGGNRLSRLIEGVTTAFIGDDDDVIVKEGEKVPLPAYYQDDPIAARICELFDEMEPLEKIFGENNNEEPAELEEPVVKLRPKPVKGGGGLFGRKKQTVSGYFSDWTKWLRGSEAARGGGGGGEGTATPPKFREMPPPVGAAEGSAAADRRAAAKCNGRE